MTLAATPAARLVALPTASALPVPGARMAKPFVKWAGGKRGLLPAIAPHFPTTFDRYFEPFLGGGAVFYHVDPVEAVLGDLNAELVTAYRVIRDHVEDLVAWLREQPFSEAHFLVLRALDPGQLGEVERAGRMIYLNRTCFNGLYRVNRDGRFNVAWGKQRDPLICDETNLRAVSRQLQRAIIFHRPHHAVTTLADPGDWVFYDPPYDGTYTGYTADGFDLAAQVHLADEFDELTARGVKAVMTNADTPIIRELYGRHTVRAIQAPRHISCKASTRRPAAEVVVTNEEAFRSW